MEKPKQIRKKIENLETEKLKKNFLLQLNNLNLKKSILIFWEYLRTKKPDSFRILDVGSGDGSFLKYILNNEPIDTNDGILADSVYYIEPKESNFQTKNVVGLDKYLPTKEPWQIQADMAKIPLENGSCDVVTANGVVTLFIDSNDKGYPFHSNTEGQEYNFEEIIKELLRVTANPGVCMFDISSYHQCDDLISFQNDHPHLPKLVSNEELEKRKVFLKQAFAFLQSLRNEGYAVNFIPVTHYEATPVLTSMAVHITKNPESYAKLEQEVFAQEENIDLENQLYLRDYPEFIAFTYDFNYQLYPGAQTLKDSY